MSNPGFKATKNTKYAKRVERFCKPTHTHAALAMRNDQKKLSEQRAQCKKAQSNENNTCSYIHIFPKRIENIMSTWWRRNGDENAMEQWK